MRIVFNLFDVGLGNNGGSRTIVRCAETLSELGAEVILCSNIPSRYTWHRINKNVKTLYVDRVPKSDIIVATGYNSVPSTLASKSGRKFYYIRGLELWKANIENLISSYKKLSCIVNSRWLHNFLKSKNINSELVYPGLDELWHNKQSFRDINIGGIYHKKHKTKRHKDILRIAKSLKVSLSLLNRDLKEAGPQRMCDWYNRIKVWCAPTELEGLHNPPIEASLCGAAILCTDHPRSGMTDYVIHRKTALVFPSRRLDIAAKYAKELLASKNLRDSLNQEMVKLLKQKIGSRQKNMKRLFSIFKNSVN